MATEKHTPLMKQYFDIRKKYSDALLFFQVGDFFELFFDDAKNASAYLAIALTKRGKNNGQDIPLCGIPVHALDHYLTKLIKGGFKVALCEQITEPTPGKVVERAVTKVFTPGTLTDEKMLDNKSASYLLSFYPDKDQWGMIFTEIMTAQMFATCVPVDSYRMIEAELVRFSPDEIVIPAENSFQKFDTYFRKSGYVTSHASLNDDVAGEAVPSAWIDSQFSDAITNRLKEHSSITSSLNLLYWYLKKNQKRALSQFKSIQFYSPDDYLVLDSSTQKNLEIIKNSHDGGTKHTLFSVVDKAVTPMGSRMIKKWLQRPLVQKQAIVHRQEMVVALKDDVSLMQKLEELLHGVSDLERIVGRIALQRAHVQDYLALKNSLIISPHVKQLLSVSLPYEAHGRHSLGDDCLAKQGDSLGLHLAQVICDKISDFSSLVNLLESAINNDETSSKWIIKTGFDQELDRLRDLVENSQKEVLKLERKESARTGISSLKIRYNNIAGYYIEVTKPNVHLVPDDYIQQNTLVNRSRYVTQELKDLEREILKAQNEIDEVQKNIYERVKKYVEEELVQLRSLAQSLSYLDALLGFARISYDNNYVSPTFVENRDIKIKQGRHPVVENSLNGSSFIPNDTSLTEEESVWILTGPNMGGKSTYLRQVALISIMAQSGCLIPAESAQLPILDRIFTRIGSGDNLAQGKSTFLVEMEETAVICSQATKNSLVILDEVGRGTSTYDGMAIAQAIIEYIVQKIQARCLFATHYHELTHLKDYLVGVENYHVASKRTKNGILFLHKVIKGVSEGSFGIEVAKLADLPASVVGRAKEILDKHDSGIILDNGIACQAKPWRRLVTDQKNEPGLEKLQHQITKLQEELAEKTKILEDLEKISLDELSPKQAFDVIWKIKEKL